MFAYTKIMQALAAAGVVPASSDPYFNLTTLLLNTSSTNGAQNNTFLDSSSSPLTITRNGNVTQGTFTPFSQTGWSGYFDGASDYIQFTNSDFSVSTGDFTAEWFMFITSDKAQVGVMTAATNSNLTIGYGSGSANARQPYVEWGGAGVYIGTMSNYMNTWVHICVMRSSGTVYTFQNGTLLSSASKSASVGATTNMVIGTNAGDVAGQGVPGYLSNVRFAKAAIYSTTGFTAPTSALTRTSQSATNVQFLTLQSNRFLDSNGVNTPASSPLAITTYNDVSVQAFSPFAPTAAYDAAVVGGSGYFDGSGDYLVTPSNATVSSTLLASDFTIECWLYLTTYPGGGAPIWTNSTSNSDGFSSVYVTSSGTIAIGKVGVNEVVSTATVVRNAWNHFATVRSGSTVYLYLNGAQIVSGAASTYLDTSSAKPLQIAQSNQSSPSALTGYISGYRAVSSALYTGSTYTIPTSVPTAISGTTLLLNFTNAGIYDSAAKNVLETVGNAQVSTTQAKWGTTSMYFDGSGDWLAIPYGPNLAFGTGDFTIEMWIYPTQLTGGTQYNLFNTGPNGSGQATLRISTAGKLVFFADNSGPFIITGATTLTANTWQHVAVTRSGTTIRIYLDGSSDANGTSSYSFAGSTTAYVGYWASDTGPFFGYMDDVRITKGYARYSGASYTVPTASFPIQ